VVDASNHRNEIFLCFLLSADVQASETRNFVLLPLFEHIYSYKTLMEKEKIKMPRAKL
jgi:hypothetical protein